MSNTGSNKKTVILAEGAIMVALSIALFAVSDLIPWPYAYGGGFSIFAQVPIVIYSYRRGIKNGVAASLVLSVFQLLTGLKNFAWVSGIGAYLIVALADYIVAFGCLGLGGMFKGKFKNPTAELALGSVVVCLIRFVCHYISGVTIYKILAPTEFMKWTFTSPSAYSLVYNGSYMLIETIITVIGAVALSKVPAVINVNGKASKN